MLSQSLLQLAYPKELLFVHSSLSVNIDDLPDSVRSNVYPFPDDAKIYKRLNSLNDHDILNTIFIT